ncbi:MAG TPA: arabinosyltransferase domain-containing protein [Candidatus Corynebacterium avicola]|uniref:Arabinosyltransferase domain-containing protein n=1 Tax=Candidatus Corynebacterium avicola TaxID=2838527 RepID=A0A9D1UM08_9CORY|nr:arabinosyltransferase domain-containing protein [Candidatus Corynebacterium avicola]
MSRLEQDAPGESSETDPKDSPTTSSSPTPKGVDRLKRIAVISGLAGLILFLLTPFLPVNQDQSSFSWPQDEELTSVTAPLMSYHPQDLDITLPVDEVRDLNGTETTVLSTVPEDAEDATLRGLFVRSTPDGLDVVVRNSVALNVDTETLQDLPEDAQLRITSDADETRAWVPDATDEDGNPLEGGFGDDIRPMLTGIYTEMANTPENAATAIDAGLNVDVTVDSRFTSSPSLAKIAAMVLGVIFTVISLTALHKMDVLDRRTGSRRRFFPAGWWRPRWLDGVVGGVLLVWYFIGGNTSDDGYLLTMARSSIESGYMSNYYRWFGVSESPFGAPYYDLLALMTHVSSASIWMRLPVLVATFLTWMLLSREVLPRLGTKIGQRKVAHWTAAMVFLAFAMTYNNGLRPEPVIALGALLTWVCMERAIATGRLLPAAIGVIVAAFSLAAGPTGLMAVASILVALSGLIRIVVRRLPLLGAGPGSSRKKIFGAVSAQIAPFLAAGTAVLIAVFGDQTLATVMEAIGVRGPVGPSLSWYEEPTRYTELLKQTVDGSFPRRFCVLMMLLCLAVVIGSMLRNRRVPGTAHGPAVRLTMVIIGTMFFMTFTPTKWTHHFGVYAGIAAGLAALAAVAASTMAMRSARNRLVFIGGCLLLFAFTLSGPNGWWYISSFGVPWWDKTVQIAGIEMSTVTMVLALLVMLFGVIVGFLNDIREAKATTNDELRDIDEKEAAQAKRFAGVASAPIAVLTAIVVVFNLASLGKAVVGQWPAYTVGKGNIDTLTGDSCQLGGAALVEGNTNESFLEPVGDTDFADSLTTEDSRGFQENNIPNRIEEGTSSAASSPETSAVATGAFGSSEDEDATDTGPGGGQSAREGANGSYAQLPFGIDRYEVPVIGSYTDGLQLQAETATSWYSLPERSENSPLLVVSAAGEISHLDMNGVRQYGQELKLEYGRSDESAEDGVEWLGEMEPLDIDTAPQWRNLRFPMDQIPEDADSVRIRAVDFNVTPDQWLAFTPPRVPEMVSLDEVIGDSPTLQDWSTPLQFPCQRPFDHYAGVAEVPEYQISPDHAAKKSHGPVMDYYGGGVGGMTEMTTNGTELPTYLENDWQRDWGVITKLTPFASSTGDEPKQAELDVESETRSGLWSPGPMRLS